jgi:lipooligosaccharide transport system permease protein
VGAGRGEFNPLHHCVELVRHCVFGFEPATDVLRVLALAVFALGSGAWRSCACAGDD